MEELGITSTASQARADVSVVICAYTDERWNDLLAAIESVRRQTVPVREILVVVDHNADLLERLRQAAPDVVSLANAEHRGLSGARNTGVAAARGELVAFLDDDALAEPTWIERLRPHFQSPDVLGVGGAVEPLWSTKRPGWFPSEFLWVVGCSYRGLPDAAGPVRNPIGASMMFRRDVLVELGGFRSGIGRQQADLMGCEETELSIRARQRWPHRIVVYEPQARVRHRVPATRTRWRYFRSRCYAEGRSKARISGMVDPSAALSSEWAYTLRTLPAGVLSGLRDLCTRRDRAGLARSSTIVLGLGITTAGYLSARLGARRDPRRDSSGQR